MVSRPRDRQRFFPSPLAVGIDASIRIYSSHRAVSNEGHSMTKPTRLALRQIPRQGGRPADIARTGGCLRELPAASIQPAYKLGVSVRLCASGRASRQAVRLRWSGCPKIAFARSRLREEARAVAVPQEDGPCYIRAQAPGVYPTLSGVGSSDTGR